MTQRRKMSRRADWWLGAAVAVIAAVLGVCLWLLTPQGGQVQVTVDGQVVMTLPLDTDTVVTVHGAVNDNTLTIADGTASMTDAGCPDRLCVHHGAISRTGESIICLPNRIVVTVVGGDAALDGEV